MYGTGFTIKHDQYMQKHITLKRISRSQSWALLEGATSQSEFTS